MRARSGLIPNVPANARGREEEEEKEEERKRRSGAHAGAEAGAKKIRGDECLVSEPGLLDQLDGAGGEHLHGDQADQHAAKLFAGSKPLFA